MYSVLVAATAMIFCEAREAARHARGGGSESGARAAAAAAAARLVRVEGSMQDPLRKVERLGGGGADGGGHAVARHLQRLARRADAAAGGGAAAVGRLRRLEDDVGLLPLARGRRRPSALGMRRRRRQRTFSTAERSNTTIRPPRSPVAK